MFFPKIWVKNVGVNYQQNIVYPQKEGTEKEVGS